MRDRAERGFTLIEVLVGIALMSVVSVGFYQVLFATTSGSQSARSVARVSEEARLGLNRLVRDAREAADLKNPSASSYQIEIDFDADTQIEPTPLDPAGNYELMIVSWNASARTVSVSNGPTTEVLIRGVDCIRKSDGTCHDMFSYSSSRLEYDTDGDGVTSASELDDAPSLGNGNNILDGQELNFVDAIRFSFTIRQDDREGQFYAEAQLRNQR